VLDPGGLTSPSTNEYTIGVGSAIGSKGFFRGDFVFRDWDKFYTAYRDTSTGKTTDQFGNPYDKSIIRSNNNVYNREYRALQTQFSYRPLQQLNLGGTYTWSRLKGNVVGEDTGSGPLVGDAGTYPEYRQASWNFPTGDLAQDQRHRARLWGGYDFKTII